MSVSGPVSIDLCPNTGDVLTLRQQVTAYNHAAMKTHFQAVAWSPAALVPEA